MTANDAWYDAVYACCHEPDCEVMPRGQRTRERLGDLRVIDLTQPVVTLATRKLGYRFLCAEAAWMLAGDDQVTPLAPYSREISKFSDDGETFFGAYGPKIAQQLPYVLGALRRDLATRQAVLNIWRESPPPTKDPPCTLSCQFLVRGGQLNVFVDMRSSDVWLGLPYDLFNFALLASYVLLELGEQTLRLGHLYQYSASRHLYERDWEKAEALTGTNEQAVLFTPKLLNPLAQFNDGADLIAHLWALARRDHAAVKRTWLTELLTLGGNR